MSGRPDFVMVGGQSDGMFYLIASKALTEVELRVEAEHLDELFDFRMGRQKPVYRQFLTAEMRDYVVVAGRDYAEAFRTLFEEWTPGAGDQPAIAGQRALRETTQRARNIAYHELGIETDTSGPRAIGG